MAQKQRTYTVRNKLSGDIVGYWDNLPNDENAVKARLRQEFGQGRFQITYTGRKKVVDDDGKERTVTHPVNQFFIVGNVSAQRQHYADHHSMGGNFSGNDNYRWASDSILINDIRLAVIKTADDVAALSDNIAIIRSNVESMVTEDEGGTFDDEAEEKSGFGIEALASNPKYAWAIPLFIAGDKDALIAGVVEKMKTEPTLLHDFISDLVGGAMDSE